MEKQIKGKIHSLEFRTRKETNKKCYKKEKSSTAIFNSIFKIRNTMIKS